MLERCAFTVFTLIQCETIGAGSQGIRRRFRRALHGQCHDFNRGAELNDSRNDLCCLHVRHRNVKKQRIGAKGRAFSIVSAPVAASPQIFQFDRSPGMDILRNKNAQPGQR